MDLSIIIPAYNVEKYLPRCIDSIVCSDISSYEIVIVDDGSIDNTGRVADEYARIHANITVIHTTNCGVSSARNTGIEAAKGDYYFFMDSDDEICSEGFESIIRTLSCDKSIDVAAFGFFREFGPNDVECNILWNDLDGNGIIEGADVVFKLISPGYIWNKVFKKELFDSARFDHRYSYGEDTLLLTYVLLACDKALIVNRQLYRYYCKRDGNTVSQELNPRYLDLLKANREVYDLLKDDALTAGIARCITAGKTVAARIDSINKQKDYFSLLTNTCRFPFKELWSYMVDSRIRESKMQRLSGVLLSLMPRFYLFIYNRILRRKK